MTIASIMVLVSCLVVMGSFWLLLQNIDANLEQLGLLNEIVVFIDSKKTDEEVAEIGAKIRALDNVAEVTFVSKEQALEEERERYAEYTDIYTMLAEDNPLRDSFVIKYVDNAKVATLDYQVGQIDGVARVNNRLDIAVAIEKLKSGISMVLIWFMVILFVVSIFVIINTIKLAVHSRRTEITIMRYIGATDWFVILPFIFEGILIGIISSILAYLIEWYMYGYVITMIGDNFNMLTILSFKDIHATLAIAFVGIGIVTGIIGSTISTRRYLKA